MAATLSELLDPHRDDAPEAAIVLLDDLEMMRVAVAWTRVAKSWREPRRAQPTDPDEVWMWLWDGVHFEPEELARAAGVPAPRAMDKLGTLMRVRAALPDGTVKKSVLGFIRATIAKGAGL